jgi:hypothetical protein
MSPNSPTNIASSPAATDNTANLFGSTPLDNESNRSAPPTNWCSACRNKPWGLIRSRIGQGQPQRTRAQAFLSPEQGWGRVGGICPRRPSGTLHRIEKIADVRGGVWTKRGRKGVGGIGPAMLTGVDDHAVGEVRAVRARGPSGGATPLLHPQNWQWWRSCLVALSERARSVRPCSAAVFWNWDRNPVGPGSDGTCCFTQTCCWLNHLHESKLVFGCSSPS